MPTLDEWRSARTFWPPHEVPEQLRPLLGHVQHPPIGIYVGPGWFGLVAECHLRAVDAFPDYAVGAIKQKFGRLAFQANPRRWEGPASWTSEESFAPFVSASSTFSCPSTGVDGEAGSSPGFEVFYWDAITGVRVLVQSRDPFTVDLCPMPPARFPPRPDKYGARRRIEWV
jgi:hypothetical protein